jgi:hypothetical protein
MTPSVFVSFISPLGVSLAFPMLEYEILRSKGGFLSDFENEEQNLFGIFLACSDSSFLSLCGSGSI